MIASPLNCAVIESSKTNPLRREEKEAGAGCRDPRRDGREFALGILFNQMSATAT
jgi:hypothetical protein